MVDAKVRALAFRGLDPAVRGALPVVVREQESSDCDKGRKPQPLSDQDSVVRIRVTLTFSHPRGGDTLGTPHQEGQENE